MTARPILMKALTICQPYAHLICLPESDPRHKRVENRTWETNYSGPLLIHAGKSRAWLDYDCDIPINELAFGAIVARCVLVACLHIDDIGARNHNAEYSWVRDHDHAHGPWCWILSDVMPLSKPIPYRGAQGLFNVPAEVMREAK